MSATADIRTNTEKDVPTVPIQAVTTREDTSKAGETSIMVWTISNDSAVMRMVTTGIRDDSYIQILDGLKEG